MNNSWKNVPNKNPTIDIIMERNMVAPDIYAVTPNVNPINIARIISMNRLFLKVQNILPNATNRYV